MEKLRGEALAILQDYREKLGTISKEGRTEHARKEAQQLRRKVGECFRIVEKAPSHYLPEILQILTAKMERIRALWQQFRAEINSRES